MAATGKHTLGRTARLGFSRDVFLDERTWNAVGRIASAKPNMPWMVISDSRDTRREAERKLHNASNGLARFVKGNGGKPMRGIFFLDDMDQFMKALQDPQVRYRRQFPQASHK